MNNDLQWSRNREEFSINRRRDLKSKKSFNLKDISSRYLERSRFKETNDSEKARSRVDLIQSKKAKEKTKPHNEVIVYENKNTVAKFWLVMSKFNIWEEHDISIIISSKDHMSIDLKLDWADKIKSNKIYFLESNEKVLINEIFDNLHAKDKMKWSIKSISFEYSVFVIYRTIMKDEKSIRKNRVVMNIRELNAIIVFDAYSMSAQTNIIVAVTECQYISVMNVLDYFYQ